MASMEDLIATISGGMHVGQQANDLKDLQAKLSQTLNPTIPTYRPVPPSSNALNNTTVPPAPASSWNSPPPTNGFLSSSPYTARQMAYPTGVKSSGNKRDVGFAPVPAPAPAPAPANTDVNDNGKTTAQQPLGLPHQGVPIQRAADNDQERPYHTEVLPERASPANTDGFADDAFKPIWNRDTRSPKNAFTATR